MKMSKVLKLFSLLFVLTIVLTACGGNDTAADATDAAGEGGAVAAAAGDRIIRVGVSGFPDLDPAIATTGSSVMAVNNMYDALVFPGRDGLEMRVAEIYTVSPDGLTWTFTIRQGIMFHDGTELRASDVAFSMNRKLAIGEGYAWMFDGIVDRAEATGDFEVVFHLSRAFGPFLHSLVRLHVLNEALIMANLADGPFGEFRDYGRTFLLNNSAGSGPFMFGSYGHQEFFEAVRFEGWFVGWENRPHAPDGFRQLIVPEPATVRLMMEIGEMDMTDQWQTVENLAAMAEMDGITIGHYSTYLVQNMYLNTARAPMDCINFRRAMAALMDYDTIIDQIFIGSRRAQGPVASGVAGSIRTNVIDFSIDRAREFLAASIYADTFQNYTIELVAIADVADAERVALVFQAAAAQVGITVEIANIPWVSVIDRLGSVETTPHMVSINSGPAFDDAGVYLMSRYHSSTTGTWEQGEWLLHPELDRMLEEALVIADDAERFAAYAVIQNFIVDELYPTIWLCDVVERIAFRSDQIRWPLVDDAPAGQVGSTLFGFHKIFADFELRR